MKRKNITTRVVVVFLGGKAAGGADKERRNIMNIKMFR